MVQVENEAGVWGGVRDYGAAAQKAFAGPVPEKLVKGLGKQPGTWKEVFGEDADETFEAWYTAAYIEQVAAAGKAEYGLPLYVNAALRDPMHPGKAPSYESGAPTDNNIGLWKIAAPSIDAIAPDIYLPEYAKYLKVIGSLWAEESVADSGDGQFASVCAVCLCGNWSRCDWVGAVRAGPDTL